MTVLKALANEKSQEIANEEEDAFIGRRFGVVLFQNSNGLIGENSVEKEPRRGFLDDFAETADLQEAINGLDSWADGEWSDKRLLDHYKRTLCGEPDTRCDKKVFRWLTKKCFTVVDNDIRYNGSSAPKLFSNWIVFNSVILREHFVPTIRYSEGKPERDWPMIYNPVENNQTPFCTFSTATPDWNALAYDSFLSREVFKRIFGTAKEEHESIVRPSLAQYMSTHSGSDVEFRSLTFTYARLGADRMLSHNQLSLQEDAFNALDLRVWDLNVKLHEQEKDRAKAHEIVAFDFNGRRERFGGGRNCAYYVDQVQKLNENLFGGTYFQDLKTDKGTCSYVACLTAMYFDFLFLRRYEPWASSPSIDDWVKAFVKRWLEYLDNRNNFPVRHAKHDDLIREILKQLLAVQKGYAKIREDLTAERLPRALIVSPSPSAASEKKPSVQENCARKFWMPCRLSA